MTNLNSCAEEAESKWNMTSGQTRGAETTSKSEAVQ
jgi:hypothetical protein